MFGHQDDQEEHHHHDDQPLGNVLSEPVADGLLSHDDQSGAVVGDGGVHDGGFNPALPANDGDQPGANDDQTASEQPAQEAHAEPTNDPAPAAEAPTRPAAPGNDDLLSIKQQALNALSPLVQHLDQSPEERFRTTMMMIQASDNQDLIGGAYEAAQGISDEKIKAQALLDIVNEINYFTQQSA